MQPPMIHSAIESRRLACLKKHQIPVGQRLNGVMINKSKEPVNLVQDWGNIQTSEEEMA